MSYDIYLKDPVTYEVLQLDAPHDMRGGTYCIGGTKDVWLNITYNYGRYYHSVFDPVYRPEHPEADNDGNLRGIRSIYGMTGAESIPVLQKAANQLIVLAKMRPDGVWDGD